MKKYKLSKDTTLGELGDLLWQPITEYGQEADRIDTEETGGLEENSGGSRCSLQIDCQLDYLEVAYKFYGPITTRPLTKFLKEVEKLGGNGFVVNDKEINVEFINAAVFN